MISTLTQETLLLVSYWNLVLLIENSLKPGKYIVTGEQGVHSTVDFSMNSDNVTLHSKNTVLEIIKIKHIATEKRIRGQIKKSLDWVSMKNTKNGYMWMTLVATISKFLQKMAAIY